MIGFSISGNGVDWGFSELEGGMGICLRGISEMQTTVELSENPPFSKKTVEHFRS